MTRKSKSWNRGWNSRRKPFRRFSTRPQESTRGQKRSNHKTSSIGATLTGWRRLVSSTSPRRENEQRYDKRRRGCHHREKDVCPIVCGALVHGLCEILRRGKSRRLYEEALRSETGISRQRTIVTSELTEGAKCIRRTRVGAITTVNMWKSLERSFSSVRLRFPAIMARVAV